MKATCNFASLLLGALVGGALAYLVASDPKKRAIIQRLADDIGGAVEEKIAQLKTKIAQAVPSEWFEESVEYAAS
jgi:hypothetical protein